MVIADQAADSHESFKTLMCRVDTVGGWGIQLILFCLQSILGAIGEADYSLPKP